MDPRRAIALLALKEDRLDLGTKTVTSSRAFGPSGRSTLPSIIAATGDADNKAHEPDGVLGGVGGDERKLRPPRLQAWKAEGRARHAGSSALRACRPGHHVFVAH